MLRIGRDASRAVSHHNPPLPQPPHIFPAASLPKLPWKVSEETGWVMAHFFLTASFNSFHMDCNVAILVRSRTGCGTFPWPTQELCWNGESCLPSIPNIVFCTKSEHLKDNGGALMGSTFKHYQVIHFKKVIWMRKMEKKIHIRNSYCMYITQS